MNKTAITTTTTKETTELILKNVNLFVRISFSETKEKNPIIIAENNTAKYKIIYSHHNNIWLDIMQKIINLDWVDIETEEAIIFHNMNYKEF